MEISVIVPVYNAEQYIKRCVDSILNQTFLEFELILVDDGSTDRSGAICDEYQRLDSRVRVFHQENKGQAAARNFAVAESNAEWIAFVDADDLIHPQYLEILYELVSSSGMKISICSAVEAIDVPDDFDQPVSDYRKEWVVLDEEGHLQLRKCMKFADCVVWGKLISKEILLMHPFSEEHFWEDCVAFIWNDDTGEIVFTREILYFYQINLQGTTKQAFSEKYADRLWASKQWINYFSDRGYTELLRIEGKNYFMICVDTFQKFRTELHDEKGAAKIREDFLRHEKEYMRYVTLSSDEKEWIMAAFHPKKFRIYCLAKKVRRASGKMKELLQKEKK